MRKVLLTVLCCGLFLGGCSQVITTEQHGVIGATKCGYGVDNVPYDMRTDLDPKRLTIAMWDYSWLYGHHPGGPFEDWEKCVNELKERKFNTVRIDCFPIIVWHMMTNKPGEKWHVPANPHNLWGPSTKDHDHDMQGELVEFVRICKEKDVLVILSTWGGGRQMIESETANETREKFWQCWETVIDLLAEHDLLDTIAYVDFDQEFPFFTPMKKFLDELGDENLPANSTDAMQAAGEAWNHAWKPAQWHFVKDYMHQTLLHFQRKYPQLRFTFSLTAYWDDIRAMGLWFDVLELHVWIHEPRFDERTGFNPMPKERGTDRDYSGYMQKLDATMASMRPMLMQQMHNKMKKAMQWSLEAAAPLVTTESWGPWWHMDHKDLDWQWLYDWCEDCMAISDDYLFWGVTPWNYAHPYWDNWENVEWYRRVNGRFLDSAK